MAPNPNTPEQPENAIVAEVMTRSAFSSDELRSIESWDDAIALVQSAHGTIANATEEIGDGFALLKDKNLLCGVPVMFMEWAFHPGEYGDVYVSARVLAKMPGTRTPAKFIVNDGSTGIASQLKEFQERTGKAGGLFAAGGLRRSDYDYEDPDTGEKRPANTFYIDTSSQ